MWFAALACGVSGDAEYHLAVRGPNLIGKFATLVAVWAVNCLSARLCATGPCAARTWGAVDLATL